MRRREMETGALESQRHPLESPASPSSCHTRNVEGVTSILNTEDMTQGKHGPVTPTRLSSGFTQLNKSVPPLKMQRTSEVLLNDDADSPQLYSESLMPASTEKDLAAFQHTMMQQQIAIERMKCLQQLQHMQQPGQHFPLPIEQALLCSPNSDFPGSVAFPSPDALSIMQQSQALQAMQQQQQLLYQQNQFMQAQRVHQLMTMMQQQALLPPAHLSFEWNGGQSHSQQRMAHEAAANAVIGPQYTQFLAAQTRVPSFSSAPANAGLFQSHHLAANSGVHPVYAIPHPAASNALQPKRKKPKKAEKNEPALSAVHLASFASLIPKPLENYFPLIGCGGKLDGQFDHPIGVTVDSGHILVCDHDNHRIQVLRCWDGAHVRTFGANKPSKIEGNFHRPQGVVVDRDHNMIVTDQGNHRVQMINYTTGQQLRSVGGFGEGESQFANPCGLAIHPSGQIVICDSGNHRLQILEANGDYVRCIGSYGRDPGQFKSPLSVSCSPDGKMVVVVEYGNLRVQVLRWSDGGHVYTINKYFKPKANWCPAGVAVDKSGRILVINSDRNCIDLFRLDNGGYIRTLGLAAPAVKCPVTPDTQLSRPRGLALSENSDIVVTDHGLNHIQVIFKDTWDSSK